MVSWKDIWPREERFMEVNMRTRLGSNQFKKKRVFLGLGLKTWRDIAIIYFLVLLPLGFICRVNQSNIYLAQFRTPKVYAVAPQKPYSEPTLNPDLSERENTSALIKRIWGKDSEIGIAIATCESGLRPNAINHNSNGTYDLGVFQINSIHEMPSMTNAVANISYAYSMYIQQGLNPWSASKYCWEGDIK